MKRVFIIILLCAMAVASSAQLVSDLHTLYNPIFGRGASSDTTLRITPFGVVKPGISYGLSVGAGYSAFGGGVGLSNTYLSPTIAYSSGDKLQVVGGLTLSRNGFVGANFDSRLAPQEASMSQTPTQLWAYAQYNLNHKLSVYALGAVEQNQTYFSPFTNGFGQYSSQHYGVGISYKLSERTSIGASFNFRNTNNPYELFSRRGWDGGNPFLFY